MVFTILVIENRKSKKVISQAVSRAIVDLRKHHPGYRTNLKKRIIELKGSKELDNRPDVRLRFFKRIARKAKFKIYSIILDKRDLKQVLPSNYMERYSVLLLNILYAIPIPKNQKWITMVVDSQAKAYPTQPEKVRYKSKAERIRQNRVKAQDRKRKNQYTQMITETFKNILKKEGTHLHVWHVRSHEDLCLQAVDAVAHFVYQRLRLNEEMKKLSQGIPLENYIYNKPLQVLRANLDTWYEAYKVLKPNFAQGFVSRPKRLVRRKIGKLPRCQRGYIKSIDRGNHEA